MKFCFLAGLPLLCLGRTLDRVNVFVDEPSAAQKAVFGRVVAYPWQLGAVKTWYDEDGIGTSWRYKLPAPPTPVRQCKSEDILQPPHPAADEQTCGMDWGGGYLSAGWRQGELWMAFDPPHIDRDAEADNQ